MPETDPAAIRAALAAGELRRVLAVRVARVGDTLHVRPALELLRAALPDAELTWLCSAYAAPVTRGAAVDRVVPYAHKGRTPGAWLARRRALRTLKRHGPYDLWLGLEDKPWGRRLARRLGCRFWFSQSEHGTHVVERKAGVLAGIGLWDPASGPPPTLSWRPGDDVGAVLDDLPRPRIGLQAGSHASAFWRAPRRRRDPDPAWLLQAGLALHRELGAGLVVHAGRGGVEARVARRAVTELRAAGARAQLAAGLSLDGLGRTLTQLDAFVGANTGPLHMAAAVGLPVVLLRGPTAPGVAPPWRTGDALQILDLGLPCSPCKGTPHGRACLVPRCLDEIPAEQVVRAVATLLER